jgi:hypothetical protein
MFAQSQQTGVALSATHSSSGNNAHIGTATAAIRATATSGNAIETNGDLYVDGAYKGGIGPNGGAPFPRPAYNSGWVDVPANSVIIRDTGLPPPLYSNDNFFIKLRVRTSGSGEWGSWKVDYHILTDNTISVWNNQDFPVQIKLWVWYVN